MIQANQGQSDESVRLFERSIALLGQLHVPHLEPNAALGALTARFGVRIGEVQIRQHHTQSLLARILLKTLMGRSRHGGRLPTAA